MGTALPHRRAHGGGHDDPPRLHDLTDLTELAAALSLAGDEGAAVRDTVSSKAKSIRERLTANAERDAPSITARMGIPATLLLPGFMIFLGFPAIYVLFQ